VFPNGKREGCRQGWQRWREITASEADYITLHPHGALPPPPQDDDYWIFASTGPLRFVARANAVLVPELPKMWLNFMEIGGKVLIELGQNPRSRARAFVHNSLVDGYVFHPMFGPAMAGAIAWLLSSATAEVPMQLNDYHVFGYDITHVPGPPGQKSMFNFRALFHPTLEGSEGILNVARDVVPLPGWQPPPH
jgi:hypothetical protein